VEVIVFSSFEDLLAASSLPIVHYFVSAQLLVEHTAFFLERQHQTIVMVSGSGTLPQAGSFHTIDINVGEKELLHNIFKLMSLAHSHGRNLPPAPKPEKSSPLSAREIEVLSLIVKGYLNKEIAEQLFISLTTVISHRKNIMEKLNIHTVSALTIYAVVNGYVDVSEI